MPFSVIKGTRLDGVIEFRGSDADGALHDPLLVGEHPRKDGLRHAVLDVLVRGVLRLTEIANLEQQAMLHSLCADLQQA